MTTQAKSIVQEPADPEQSSSAVDRVIGFIKAGIREGRFVPGQRLVEPELTELLKVSRGPLREALRRLAAEGSSNSSSFAAPAFGRCLPPTSSH